MTNRLGWAAFVATTYLFPAFRMFVTSVSPCSPAISLNHPTAAALASLRHCLTDLVIATVVIALVVKTVLLRSDRVALARSDLRGLPNIAAILLASRAQ